MKDEQIEEVLEIVNSCTCISVDGERVEFREIFELILNHLNMRLVRIPESIKLVKKGDRINL